MSWVTVRFYGPYVDLTKKRRDRVPVRKDSTVRQFLHKLSDKYGPAFAEALWTSAGELRREVRLFLGQDEVSRNGLDGPVPDEVTFFVFTGLGGG